MTALEAHWSPVQHLILGDDPQARVYGEVFLWFRKLELFRKEEEERIFAQKPTAEDLEVHRRLLQRLIADGEHLLKSVQQAGLPSNLGGAKPEDLAAAVEGLWDTFRGWYQPLSAGERSLILKELFPDVP
jgi:hypothetical protein